MQGFKGSLHKRRPFLRRSFQYEVFKPLIVIFFRIIKKILILFSSQKFSSKRMFLSFKSSAVRIQLLWDIWIFLSSELWWLYSNWKFHMFLFFCTKIGVNEFLHPHQKLYSRYWLDSCIYISYKYGCPCYCCYLCCN